MRPISCLNGTSTANQIVAHACVVAGDVVLADRNCHKSINYALTVTDAIPVYLMPSRNGYGIIGPIPPARLSPRAIAEAVRASPLADGASRRAGVRRRHQLDLRRAVLPRRPGDRSCLGQSVPRVHFDEAWFAYARFHPLYADRYAMHDRTRHRGPDDLCHAVDPQAARRLLPGLDDPHPLERAGPGRAVPVQRGLHDARLDLAVLPDDRLSGRGHGDDGRPRRARSRRGSDP